jgi:hypothetical protein
MFLSELNLSCPAHSLVAIPPDLSWLLSKYIPNSYIFLKALFLLINDAPVNNNTFCFATIDKVFYYVASVFTTCFSPYIRPSSSELTKY